MLALQNNPDLKAARSDVDLAAAQRDAAAAGHWPTLKAFGGLSEYRRVQRLYPAATPGELGALSSRYREAPPPAYAADPLWKSYFEDLADIVGIVRERVRAKAYRLAQRSCGQICMTFGRMHRTNGLVALTDLLFSLRMEVKHTQDMVNAGNVAGARAEVLRIGALREAVSKRLGQPSTAALGELAKPLSDAYEQWVRTVDAGNAKETKTSFGVFMQAFPKLYGATF
ncbi:MAG: TolC family protein [Myxococcota bacterium]